MLRKENILIIISITSIIFALFFNLFIPQGKNNKSQNVDSEIKASFKDSVNEYVSEEISGLGFGYLLGEKSELPSGFENKMKAVGLAHIIVVSGTHLSIIIGASRKLFEKISRFAAFYFSILLLVLYIFIIGISPSIVRASFVAVLSLVAWYFGRRQKVSRTIILTLGFCLLIDPYYLINVSFQLSMLAYSGVVVIMPVLVRYFYGRDKPGLFGSTILSSLSAIIACLPIQLYYFGSLNLVSLFANLLILPTIPFAMGAVFFVGVLGLFHFSVFATMVGKIAEIVLFYHFRVVSELYDRTEFLFEIEKNNPAFLALYVIIACLLFVSIHKNIKVSKGDTGDHNNPLVCFNETQDVLAESVERNEVCDAPRAERNQKCCENCSLGNAKDAKNTSTRGP